MEEHAHTAGPATPGPSGTTRGGDGHEAGHSVWLMVLCCVPMILFVAALALGWLGR